MSCQTTCTICGALYEAGSEEQANELVRYCRACTNNLEAAHEPGPGRFPFAEGKCSRCGVRVEPMREGDPVPELCNNCENVRAAERSGALCAAIVEGLAGFYGEQRERELRQVAGQVFARRCGALGPLAMQELVRDPIESSSSMEVRELARFSLAAAKQFAQVAYVTSPEQEAAELFTKLFTLLVKFGVGS